MKTNIQSRVFSFVAILVAVASISLSGCASTAQVRSAPGADIAGYDTFGFVKQFGTDRAGYSSFLSTSLKSAATAALEAKGYKYTDTNPQMLVNFSGKSQQKTEVTPGMGPGLLGFRAGLYGGWAGYNAVEQYDEGTVIMDLVDASKNELVWEGSTNIVKNDMSQWTDKDVQKMVQTIMAQIPAAR